MSFRPPKRPIVPPPIAAAPQPKRSIVRVSNSTDTIYVDVDAFDSIRVSRVIRDEGRNWSVSIFGLQDGKHVTVATLIIEDESAVDEIESDIERALGVK